MSNVTIPREHWRTFFDRMSKGLLGKRAEVEVASLELGDQITAEWVPLLGITYDSRDDLIDVAFDRANHLIRHPSQTAQLPLSLPTCRLEAALLDGICELEN